MYNGNIQQNSLCVESCVTISHLSPFLACVFSSRCNFTTPTSTPLYSSRLYAQKTLCSKVFIKRAARFVQRARSTCTVSLVRRAIIALGWRSELTGVQRTTEYIDAGIEHNTPCRNGQRITEYMMKEVPSISRNGILIGQSSQFFVHPTEPKLMHLTD